MLDATTYKKISNLKAMAELVVKEADEVLKKETAEDYSSASFKKRKEQEIASKVIAQRRKNVAASAARKHNSK